MLVARSTPATEVLAFGVFAEDDEVDGRNAQGRQVGVEQLYRTEIDVEIELESQTQEDVAGMFVARHPRIAECAEEDGIDVVAQMVKGGVGERLSRLEIVIRGIGKSLPRESERVLGGDSVQNGDCRLDDLGSDPIARDHRNTMGLQRPVIRSPSASRTRGSRPSRRRPDCRTRDT